jgi:hypothetical protein
MIKKIPLEEGADAYINVVLKYWLTAAETEKTPKEFIEKIQQELPTRGGVMTIAEQLRQEGVQRGESTLLVRQLERKFRLLPDQYRQKIQQANAEKLLIWGERVLDTECLEEIFA